MAHDHRVGYQEELLRGVRLDGWQVQENGGVVVSGPCPKCHGDAYGPELPLADAVKESTILYFDRAPDRILEIVAACHCGHAHGRDDATNCGRRWVVVVKLTESGP